MRYGPLQRILSCAIGHPGKFGDGLLATAACGYALCASVVVLVNGYGPMAQDFVMCYGPQRQTNYHGTEPQQYFKSLSNFLKEQLG
jgi:hypothetical protein